jgi:hypothetical protein
LFAQQTGSFTLTGSMNAPRTGHTATLLNDGRVLVAGGCASNAPQDCAQAELYNPATGLWKRTNSMSTRRSGHTATLLKSGKVLVAGGWPSPSATPLATAEIFDPSTGTWTSAGSMSTIRGAHAAVLFRSGPLDGKVLVAGGTSACGGCTPILASAELFDPENGTWVPTGAMQFRPLLEYANCWDISE